MGRLWWIAAPALLAAALLCGPAAAQDAAGNQAGAWEVREDRPRIMLTPERIEALKAKTASTPPPGSEIEVLALRYVLTGEEAAADEAIAAMLAFDLAEEVLTKSVASDQYRWGAGIPVVYDWCHDRLTPEQRAAFLARYGRIAGMMNAKSWGGPGMPGSNYYSGYMRNSGIFGLAAFGETPAAEALLEDALITRWRSSSLPHYLSGARGGVIGEGSQYDRYNAGYVLWLAEAAKAAAGIDMYRETNWFREFAYYTIYSTSPMPAYAKGSPAPYWQRFPFGDCHMWEGHPAIDSVTGDAMRAIALAYAEERAGRHAAEYVEEVEPQLGFLGWVVEDDREVAAEAWDDLPLDYYAPGAGHLFWRSGWEDAATLTMLTLGVSDKCSHQHLDAGTFQILRGARWMTKESTGYGHAFKGTTPRGPLAHNSLVFDGRGQANAYADARPRVLALQTHEAFAHAAVDLSGAYRASRSSRKERDDTPGAAKCIREFVFIRPDVLVVFDRMEATSPEVRKTFVLHFADRPVWTDDSHWLLETPGGQFFARTIYPEEVEVEFVDEGDVEDRRGGPGYYQWRMEASQSGATEGYFLTVLAAQERFDMPPQCQLVETEETIGVVISQPGRRSEAHFNKAIDAAAEGGSLGRLIIRAAGAHGHVESMLPAKAQEISVDADGPRWSEPLE